ncbi:MAG: hypothetical protein QM662_12730 [Gordonia sp. (in: high G+C Gram-positive bacteria)]
MHPPLPDSKALGGELLSFSGTLGQRSWVGQQYSPTAALILGRPSVPIADPATVVEVIRAITDVVDPLSRYTAGWCDSLAALRPPRLRNPVATAVREAQRSGVRAVRRDMTGGPAPVHRTATSVHQFLAHPQARHRHDEMIALNAFVTKVARLVADGRTGSTLLTRDELQILTRLSAELIEAAGATPARPPTEDQLAEYRRIARAVLDRVVREQFTGAKYPREYLSEAYARVLTTYVNRLARGQSLDGTDFYLRLRLRAVEIDEWRREVRRGRHESASGPAERGPADTENTGDTATDDGALRTILTTAISIIATDPAHTVDGRLSWEAAMAISLLENHRDHGRHPNPVETVIAAWDAQRPTTSRSPSARAAAMAVQLLMRTAINLATRRHDENPGAAT